MGERHAAAMLDIWMRNRELMLAHVAEIERFVEPLAAGATHEPGECDRLNGAAIEAAHSLRGVLGTFGMPSGCRLAQQVETALDEAIDVVAAGRLAECVRCLRDVVEAGPGTAASTTVR